MLDMATLTSGDYLIDLGSGDGRKAIAAAKRGIKALGIEYNPKLVTLSKRNAEKASVANKASFVEADIFASDFSTATVLTLFLLTDINIKLRPTILRMKPGTRIVSNSFGMGDWDPEQSVTVADGCTSFCRVHLWTVPARVEGAWQLGLGRMAIEQKYQNFKGTLTTGGTAASIADGKLKGVEISFTAGGTQYTGKVGGDAMEGTAKAGGSETKWQATRAK